MRRANMTTTNPDHGKPCFSPWFPRETAAGPEIGFASLELDGPTRRDVAIRERGHPVEPGVLRIIIHHDHDHDHDHAQEE
jgi:hypothetical protein